MVENSRNITVVPAGIWGSTVGKIAADAGFKVRLGFRLLDYVDIFSRTRQHPRLPGIIFPDSIEACGFLEGLSNADVLFLAPTSSRMRSLLQDIKPFIAEEITVLCLTKGLEPQSNLRMSQVLEEEISGITQRLVVLSGPNFASELLKGLPAQADLASVNYSLAERISKILQTDYFSCYITNDLVGVEYCGAFKNVVALMAGMCKGLKLGVSAQTCLITNATGEIADLLVCLGGRKETLRRLSGIGDIVTTSSKQSRNYQAGVARARGIDDFTEFVSGTTVEGFSTARSMLELADQHGLTVPIARTVYRILYEGLPVEAIKECI